LFARVAEWYTRYAKDVVGKTHAGSIPVPRTKMLTMYNSIMNEPKIVLITGGLSGIGFELTKLYISGGYKVYATTRNIQNFESLDFEGKSNVNPVEMDLLDPATVRTVVNKIIRETGHVDILINNAASGYYSSVEDIDPELFLKQFQVNVLGAVLMSKIVLPSMREQGSGKIINISSILGFSTAALNAPYSSCKYALESITETLALEVKPFGIDVILIQPGDFHTNFIKNSTVAQYTEKSPYYKLYKRMQDAVTSGKKGKDPKILAEKIYKISQKDKPALRYMVGKEVFIKKFLHTILFDNLWISFLRKYYKW
jgi:NAD(P)-dependent dehydrogenase (short-subunit alcohol dehydrogenase family)